MPIVYSKLIASQLALWYSWYWCLMVLVPKTAKKYTHAYHEGSHVRNDTIWLAKAHTGWHPCSFSLLLCGFCISAPLCSRYYSYGYSAYTRTKVGETYGIDDRQLTGSNCCRCRTCRAHQSCRILAWPCAAAAHVLPKPKLCLTHPCNQPEQELSLLAHNAHKPAGLKTEPPLYRVQSKHIPAAKGSLRYNNFALKAG